MLERPGKDNVVADFISRIKNEDDDILVYDSFLDKNLFSLSVNTPWFVDMENYLASRNWEKERKICFQSFPPVFLHKKSYTKILKDGGLVSEDLRG